LAPDDVVTAYRILRFMPQPLGGDVDEDVGEGPQPVVGPHVVLAAKGQERQVDDAVRRDPEVGVDRLPLALPSFAACPA
jgi:hypothetical protein